VTFSGTADSYDRFMGRYSSRLAPRFAQFAGIDASMRALDVGCGPGALTSELVSRLGPGAVSAVDPAERFVATVRERLPGVDVRQGSAEDLPFPEGDFDVSMAQLVVHHMTDPVAGLGEMGRVTRPGGVVAACVWDHETGSAPVSTFFRVARELDPDLFDPARLAGARSGHLGELLSAAGLERVDEEAIPFEVGHSSFEEWWDPFLLGVGPVVV
jgi:ubiquinone/menaquinone biosynthesis C-methylase UbiE